MPVVTRTESPSRWDCTHSGTEPITTVASSRMLGKKIPNAPSPGNASDGGGSRVLTPQTAALPASASTAPAMTG